MNKLILCICMPIFLVACSSKNLPTQELRDLKPACAGGDAVVCSDIGHKVADMDTVDG